MTWTGRPDDAPCCGDDPGVVRPGETVARLLHTKIMPPEGVPFTRKELTWEDQKKAFENVCGEADGSSLDRCCNLDDAELRRRAKVQAEIKPGRVSHGAIIASVDDLRAIPPPSDGAPRPVYVYDDPRADNREHAIMRVAQQLGRPAFDWVRSEIEKAFARHRVEP